MLASTGSAERPHEWFWRDTEESNRRIWRVSHFADYLACARDAGTTPNGVFGSKLMWAYLDDFLVRLRLLGDASSDRSLIADHFPSPRFVWVRRADVAAQAVSWAKAIQTGRWHHWDSREAAAHDAGWHAWFDMNEIERLVVRFEDLVADAVGATRAVLEVLGVEAGDVPTTELTVKASDRVNDEWAARYRLAAGD